MKSKINKQGWLIFGVLFGVAGTFILLKSFAASPLVAFEAEASSITVPATINNDSTASGGKYLQFGSPAPPPTTSSPAFSADSYWNTAMPANAPIDPNSATYIADSQANSQNYLNLVMGSAYGESVYYAKATDPVYTITAAGITRQVHIPLGATPATGTDAQMSVYDRTAGFNRHVGLHQASFANGVWTAAGGMDSYQLDSNGLDYRAVGSNDKTNVGHRGVSSATRTVRIEEVQAGAINRRLECFWHATAESHYWPMVNNETGKGGIVPEGIVIRIKPSVNLSTKSLKPAALVVATALQKYGCVVGDTSGSGNNLKTENVNWNNALVKDSLSTIPWTDWEFIKGGYDPITGQVR